jgi:nucleoside-diphosphate-sugar epimerase
LGAEPATVIIQDLGSTQDWSKIVSDMDFIVHCAARAHVLKEEAADPLAAFRAVNRDSTLALAEAAAAAGVRRFIFLSSIGVNGNETTGRAFRHDDPPAPHSDYAVAKWEAEQGLKEIAARTGLEVVIIRPPLVIGPNPKGNLGSLLNAVRRGIPLPLGRATRNRRDLVSLSTLTSLIGRCINHPAAAGQVFLVSDDKTLSTREIIASLASMHNLSARFLPVPVRVLSIALKLLGRKSLASQLLGDLEIDMGHTMQSLDWKP